MAVGLQRIGDWLAARRSDQCALPYVMINMMMMTLPANHRCAVGLLPLLREDYDY